MKYLQLLSPRFAFTFLSLCVFAQFVSNPANAQVSFNATTYGNGGSSLWAYNPGNAEARADLNGDGREDFISQTGFPFRGCTASFAVSLSTGDGQYAPPVCYTLPNSNQLASDFAVGDFFGHGKLDLAVTDYLNNLYIYKNNGSGALTLTRTTPLTATTTPGTYGQIAGIVAADVNHDGQIDLVYDVNTYYANTNTPTGTSLLIVLFGTGNGGFSNGPVTSFTLNGDQAGGLNIGDFDGDGIADIYVQSGGGTNSEIFYGENSGDFTGGGVISKAYYYTADANSNGTMSLIASLCVSGSPCSSTNVIDLEQGHPDRTLTSQQITLKSCVVGHPVLMADFDGDGHNDLIVAEDSDCQGNPPYTLNFLKNTANGTDTPTFAPEQVIYSDNGLKYDTEVLRASHSSRPDLTVWQAESFFNNIEQLVLVNTTAGGFPSCTPLNNRATGINVCSPASPTSPSSPVTFSLAGSSQTPGRGMELWIDGNKVDEQLNHNYSYYDFLQASVPLREGEHQVQVFSVGWDYSRLVTQFPLIVGK